ncbi:hypothetical protein CFC21_002663 [Triticum aestivum]|uniref:Uncharacterized protein n=3 Tax=Triticum TaxID=4564 RepID=A0A9R0QCA7_TRITD|nr:hypothetical protein TRIUR3_17604 [Triticum urartu]KAF6984699.1 hypothetical protein CFC21_002663 [Triticum aestivum]VAH07381.1 unnamed protein product [Triticum turgidum subsp. durum]
MSTDERMKIDSVSRFPVIKKSFSVDNAQVLPSTKPSPCKEMMTHPSSKNIERYSLAKMSIELSEDETTNTEIIGQSGHAREK